MENIFKQKIKTLKTTNVTIDLTQQVSTIDSLYNDAFLDFYFSKKKAKA